MNNSSSLKVRFQTLSKALDRADRAGNIAHWARLYDAYERLQVLAHSYGALTLMYSDNV